MIVHIWLQTGVFWVHRRFAVVISIEYRYGLGVALVVQCRQPSNQEGILHEITDSGYA